MLGDRSSAKATCWYIPTAPLRDGWSKRQAQEQMASVGRQFNLQCAWIDVEYTKGAELKAAIGKLGKVDVIYAEMGNTYNLCYHLWNSGGAELIKELMDAGASMPTSCVIERNPLSRDPMGLTAASNSFRASFAVYVGASAGSIMAGRTCQMALWKDWDDQSCEGTVSVDWSDKEVAKGLNLAGGRSIFPHANGQYADAKWQQAQAQRHGHTDHEVVALQDGHGIVIEGDAVKIL